MRVTEEYQFFVELTRVCLKASRTLLGALSGINIRQWYMDYCTSIYVLKQEIL